MPEGAPVSYPFSALGDGDVLEVGSATLEAVWTPGHTSESTSYLLDGRALLSGDTLFVSTVGRPDLDATPKGSREKARALPLPATSPRPRPRDVRPARTHEQARRIRR